MRQNNYLHLYHNNNSIMAQNTNNSNILSVLDSFTLDNADDISRQVAENFRKRHHLLPFDLLWVLQSI